MSNATLQVGGGNWAAQDGKLLGYAVEPTSGRYLAREFTVNRNSSKWVLANDGYLYEVPADQPALEYYSDGTFRGALVEPESVNEALQSEDLDNATYWTLANVTIAGDTETDPKGGTNSFLLSETVDNGGHVIFSPSAQRPSVTTGETWTQSLFVKKGDGANAPDVVQLNFSLTVFGANYANFDISVGGGTSGTVTASSGGTAGIRYYGNGWYRISFTDTVTSNGTARVALAFINNNPTATQNPSYAGQTDANVFVWGAQLEQSPIATSYIPTTTGAVTRLKDDISFTNASSVIGQSEGTLFAEVDWQDSGASQVILSINDDSVDNRFELFGLSGSDEIRLGIASNGSTQTPLDVSSSGLTGIVKLAAAYADGDSEIYINGSSIGSGTPDLSSLATLTNVDFGQNWNSGGQANMWIRDTRIYNTRLSEINCVSLTGGDDPYAPIDGNEFTWNGYNYKVIVKNGLAWLDRNLGATRAATSSTDSQAYGDLYQWGRLTDGHEKRNSGTTLTLSTTDVPGNDDFIKINTSPNDWRSPQNNNLWQGVNGINNPAPPGWRIPTELEWDTERQSWSSNNSAGAFASSLKFTKGGFRDNVDGSLDLVGNRMAYWTSTVVGTNSKGVYGGDSISIPSWRRALGFSVRCVRDIP